MNLDWLKFKRIDVSEFYQEHHKVVFYRCISDDEIDVIAKEKEELVKRDTHWEFAGFYGRAGRYDALLEMKKHASEQKFDLIIINRTCERDDQINSELVDVLWLMEENPSIVVYAEDMSLLFTADREELSAALAEEARAEYKRMIKAKEAQLKYDQFMHGSNSDKKYFVFREMDMGTKREEVEQMIRAKYPEMPMKQIRCLVTKTKNILMSYYAGTKYEKRYREWG